MKTLTDFPTKLIDGNLAFGRDGSVWAYFEVEGIGYDFRDPDQKKQPFYSQMTFLTKNAYDLHYLLIPYQQDSTDIIDSAIEDVKRREYFLKENGIRYLENLKTAMIQNSEDNTSYQYHSYLGVQLDPRKNKHREGNAGTHFIGGVKSFLQGLNEPVRNALGLDPYDILEEEILEWSEQAKNLEQEIGAAFLSPARRITSAETYFLTEYGFTMANETPKLQDVRLGDKVTGTRAGKEIAAIRPNREAYYDLQDAEISLAGPRTLKVQKVVNDEEVEQLVRYLVVDSMNSLNYHPGFEWLYKLQTDLAFPIAASVRACHKPNKTVRKELSNALLSFDDQRAEANKANTDVDRSVATSKQGAVQMEEVFQKSGHPGYSCSFVIRVTADTESELKSRSVQVSGLLDKYGVSVKSPYGDALRYFMEFIPSSPRVSEDYWQQVSPGVLAAMMFGATTSLGDGRGFLIGFTKKLRKPVFIQPDLAAKNLEGVHNLFDSLAVMVAGETGRGKSMFMNLFAALSALTLGSKVLVIDPKGDRQSWEDGLPFIPKEAINVWKLGASTKDAGSLDPFRTATDLEEAKDVWMDVGSHITGIELKDPKYALLSDAVEKAAEHKDPCGEVVMKELKKAYTNPPEYYSETRKKDLEELIGALETAQRNRLSKLLFGKVGQDYRTLSVDKPIQVLMVQNLVPPTKKTNENKNRPAEKMSEAILISITAFTKQFMMNTDQSEHKIILQDEAASIERSEMGAELIDWIQRKGRYYNTTMLKGTQKASDYEDSANIGMKATFTLPEPHEAERMLSFYNLPNTPVNVMTLQNLNRGECLFQDIYGRSAVISVNAIFKEFLNAFRTNTATEEEQEYEKRRRTGAGV